MKPVWTPEMLAIARMMTAKGYPARAVDAYFKLKAGSWSARRIYERDYKNHTPGHRQSGSMRTPPEVLAERDTRLAARDRRNQTAEFFGDPPPGYSALDRRRA
jgi:hypothetical protein